MKMQACLHAFAIGFRHAEAQDCAIRDFASRFSLFRRQLPKASRRSGAAAAGLRRRHACRFRYFREASFDASRHAAASCSFRIFIFR